MKIKLVRNLLAQVPKEGVEVLKMTPASAEHRMALAAKLHEEAAEVNDHPTDITEYADLLEVLLQIAHFNDIKEDAIYYAMMKKRQERGGFGHGYFMVRT